MCKTCKDLNRREFMAAGAVAAGIGAAVLSAARAETAEPFSIPEFKKLGKALRVKPALIYHLHPRKEASTWREWGGLKTEQDVTDEITRIQQELKEMQAKADFSMEIMPIAKVNTDGAAQTVSDTDCDVILIYAAGSAGDQVYKDNRMKMITNSGKHIVMFLRHKSGPVYLWYEIAHPKLLRDRTDHFSHDNMDIDDIVIDDYREVMWRMRALFGLENMAGTKVVSVNGIGAWGASKERAHYAMNEIWKLDIPVVSMEEVRLRMEKKAKAASCAKKAQEAMKAYLRQESIMSLHTQEDFMIRSFMLRDVFCDLIKEHDATGITVAGCMDIGTATGTTACLPFSLINDEGLMGFCESDMVVIPSGILLRYISGKPSFLNDPCFPYNGVATCAHCSAPRRMDGQDYEPTHIHTHCESDYGAAPKVDFRKGQVITNLIPDFESKKWVGFRGTITDHPFYDICRSQFDCTIDGDWKKLQQDMRGFHWMTCYGDYLNEVGYALKKVGIEFENISA